MDEEAKETGAAQVCDSAGAQADAQGEANAEMPAFTVVLASASPRRRELLEELGIPFLAMALDVDEGVDADLRANPFEAVKKIAERKAGAAVQIVLDQNPGGLFMVIGADTAVVVDGEMYGKPKDDADAVRMLKILSGRTHEVMTGVSVWMVLADAQDPEKVSVGFRSFTETSAVTFLELSDGQIADYVGTGEASDKAGAYGIQGAAGAFVRDIKGSRANVIGLPVERLVQDFPELMDLRR